MLTYFCQGHGGQPANYSPEDDYGDDDYGVVSYCLGDCTTALDYLAEQIRTGREPRPANTTDRLTLTAWTATASWAVTFTGPDAQAWALAYMAARPAVHFAEDELRPFSHAAFPALAERLYPTCEHGMSADLCEGPEHWMSQAEERAHGW